MKTTIALVLVILSTNACAPYVRYRLLKGEQGETGSTGAKGADGQGCTVEAMPGGSQVTCGASTVFIANGSDGHDGVQGEVGPTGPVGPQGPRGNPGSNGIDATPVTVVSLCPGVSSYPGVFVEVALCLGGNLYGVYSIPGSFLTFLPPGNYTSAGIGSSCNLTVGANCQITH